MAVCSLGLPEPAWASVRPDAAIEYLDVAINKTADMGCEALSGVIYGGIGQRTGKPPTQGEIDNITRVLVASAKTAKSRGIELGIEAVNRYENHIVNTAQQAVDLVERIGADNVFVHLDTYHMNIEEKGAAHRHSRGAGPPEIHPSFRERPRHAGEGNCPWDAIFAALAAIDFKGGLAMESFINLPPEIGAGLSVWRPVAKSEADVMGRGLPFLRNKALQYGLIQ